MAASLRNGAIQPPFEKPPVVSSSGLLARRRLPGSAAGCVFTFHHSRFCLLQRLAAWCVTAASQIVLLHPD